MQMTMQNHPHTTPLPGAETAKLRACKLAKAFLEERHFDVTDTHLSWVPDDHEEQTFHACMTGHEHTETMMTTMTVVVRIVCTDGHWDVCPRLSFKGEQITRECQTPMAA